MCHSVLFHHDRFWKESLPIPSYPFPLDPCVHFAAVALLCLGQEAQDTNDPRAAYDVLAYRLDLRVDPEKKEIAGDVAVELRFGAKGLQVVQLDLVSKCKVDRVAVLVGELTPDRSLAGEKLWFEHDGDVLLCHLPEASRKDEVRTLVVGYRARPEAKNRFTGFHWDETEDGRPWISTSCQALGAHSWWPCKSSFFHPEDKCERVFVNLTVPAGLTAVSNGRLTRRSKPDPRWETFHWRHDYPLETYSVTLNVGPFVEVATELQLPEIEDPVPFVYWVRPESRVKAAVQFAQVPELITIFSEAFGPFPFPRSKVGIVETSFFGMEHSTAIAYGSTFPAWLAAEGKEDPAAKINEHYDLILVHELAHEWWGNAVSAADWSDFWLHEGFTTYAEAVYVERKHGREQADAFFTSISGRIANDAALHVPGVSSSADAYSRDLYYKGACVLNTLRHYLDDDEVWWRTLRDFQMRHRYGNAGTQDFRRVLEEHSGRDWKTFFDEWVYGSGSPRLVGTVTGHGDQIRVHVESGTKGERSFHVPLDLAWTEAGRPHTRRIYLTPGHNEEVIPCAERPEDLRTVNLHRILGHHRVKVH